MIDGEIVVGIEIVLHRAAEKNKYRGEKKQSGQDVLVFFHVTFPDSLLRREQQERKPERHVEVVEQPLFQSHNA